MTAVSEWLAKALSFASTVVVADELGDLPLAKFQRVAAHRLVDIVGRYGGALVADAVGLGKTRVCLTVAKAVAKKQRITAATGAIWCVVPSRTMSQWKQTASMLGLSDDAITIVSHAAMSHGRLPQTAPVVIVIDEAHRFRNRRARKRQVLEQAPDVPLILATATPVVNSIDDLQSLLELFVDDADARAVVGVDLAAAFDGAADVTELLSEVVVRRLEPPEQAGFGSRPRARLRVVEYEPPRAEAWMWHNLEPSLAELELVAFGGDWPRGLFVEHILRRWESGPDALAESLRELLDFHERWLDAARHGSRLDRAGFRSLFGDNASQMVFRFLYDDLERPPALDEIARAESDRGVLERITRRIEDVLREGTGRDRVVVDLAQEEGKLLVFTSYRRAAEGLFARLQESLGPRARVGLVTGTQARATGLGRTTPEEILRRFAPEAAGVGTLRPHESLRVLIATDCLAEGVNLQDCGRVVLADLPYTPVGVEQRVGRLVRPGGPHTEVDVYLPRPANWNDTLGMRRRLDAKLEQADRAGVPSDNVISVRDADIVNPYAALTALDELMGHLVVSVADAPAVARVVDGSGARTIVVCQIHDGDRVRPWMFGIDEADETLTLSELLPDLAELAYDRRNVEMAEVPGRVAQVVEGRRAFLEATRLGPSPLRLDDPEVCAWRRLCGELEDPDLLDDLRARLLHRQRAAVRGALQRLAHSESSLGRLVRFVRGLPARGTDPVRIEIVACLSY